MIKLRGLPFTNWFSEVFGGLYKVRLRGSYYDMGYRYGRILKRVGFQPPRQDPDRVRLASKCRDEVERYFPEILDEARGVIESCGADQRDFLTLLLTVGLESSCTCFAVGRDATVGGRTLFARNYDMFYRLKRVCETYWTYPEGGYASIGSTDIFIGREDGVNEKGLAIGAAGVWCEGVKPGFVFPLAIRGVLDRCSGVEEAVEFLSEIPHARSFQYLLADKTGEMVVVEVTTKRVNVRYPKDDLAVITNHFQSELWREEVLERRPTDSEQRLKGVEEWFKGKYGSIDLDSTMSMLRDHESGVCSHIKEIQLGTLWSMVADLGERRAYIADGHPCRAKYRSYVF